VFICSVECWRYKNILFISSNASNLCKLNTTKSFYMVFEKFILVHKSTKITLFTSLCRWAHATELTIVHFLPCSHLQRLGHVVSSPHCKPDVWSRIAYRMLSTGVRLEDSSLVLRRLNWSGLVQGICWRKQLRTIWHSSDLGITLDCEHCLWSTVSLMSQAAASIISAD